MNDVGDARSFTFKRRLRRREREEPEWKRKLLLVAVAANEWQTGKRRRTGSAGKCLREEKRLILWGGGGAGSQHMFGHCFDNNACTPKAIMMKCISCTRLNFPAPLCAALAALQFTTQYRHLRGVQLNVALCALLSCAGRLKRAAQVRHVLRRLWGCELENFMHHQQRLGLRLPFGCVEHEMDAVAPAWRSV